MSSPMQALPTYSQWKAWGAKAFRNVPICMHCRSVIELFRDNIIRVGCRVKTWDEQVTETAEGEVIKLTSKIVPMSMTGPGCPECQYLMTKLESDELARYEEEEREWRELYKPRVTIDHIRVVMNGNVYHLVTKSRLFANAHWVDGNGIRVPTIMDDTLYRKHRDTAEQAIAAGLEPWMRALGLTAPPFQPQPDSQTRTPSKRQVYIDVTEAVLKMPRAKRREDDTYKVVGL